MSRDDQERNRNDGCGYSAQAPQKSLPGGQAKAYFDGRMTSIHNTHSFFGVVFRLATGGVPLTSLLK